MTTTIEFTALVAAVKASEPESLDRAAAKQALLEALAWSFTPEEIAEYRAANPGVSEDEAADQMAEGHADVMLNR